MKSKNMRRVKKKKSEKASIPSTSSSPHVKLLLPGEQEFREGLDYYYGAKGKKDWKEATTFFTLAANQGNLKAAYYLTLIPKKNGGPLQTNQNDTIDKKYESDSKKIIPNIDSKILEITKQFELDVKLGLKYAHHPLGICCERGDGVILKEYDLVLMSVSTEQKIDVQNIEEFLKENKECVGKPILINRGNEFILYGLSEQGEWKLTRGLNASQLKKLSFESKPALTGAPENKSLPKFEYSDDSYLPAGSELKIPGDDSCLFWSVAIGVLAPVLDDEKQYRLIFNDLFVSDHEDEQLFDKYSDGLKNRIQAFLRSNDTTLISRQPGLDPLFYLINGYFRQKVASYIDGHFSEFDCIEGTVSGYVARLRQANFWGGDIEFRAIFKLLRENYRIVVENSIIDLGDVNKPTIHIIHTNVRGVVGGAQNHYNLRIPNMTFKVIDNSSKIAPKNKLNKIVILQNNQVPKEVYEEITSKKGHTLLKDEKQAVWHYQQAADAGFDEAQIKLGFCYLHGIGIEQAIEKSLTYFEAAAKQKNAMAWYYLAVFYTNAKQYGHTTKEDMAKAIDYYRKAADAGVPEAQCFLGSYLLNRIPYGQEGPSSGIALISLAARQGLVQAYYLLANYHKSGQYGLKKDYVIATEYYQAAIRGGFEPAKVELEELEREARKLETPDNKILNTNEKSDVSGSSRVTSFCSDSSKFFSNQMISTPLDYIQPFPSNQLGNLFETQVVYRGLEQPTRSASIAEAKGRPVFATEFPGFLRKKKKFAKIFENINKLVNFLESIDEQVFKSREYFKLHLNDGMLPETVSGQAECEAIMFKYERTISKPPLIKPNNELLKKLLENARIKFGEPLSNLCANSLTSPSITRALRTLIYMALLNHNQGGIESLFLLSQEKLLIDQCCREAIVQYMGTENPPLKYDLDRVSVLIEFNPGLLNSAFVGIFQINSFLYESNFNEAAYYVALGARQANIDAILKDPAPGREKYFSLSKSAYDSAICYAQDYRHEISLRIQEVLINDSLVGLAILTIVGYLGENTYSIPPRDSSFDPGIALDGQLKKQKYEQSTPPSKKMEITPKLPEDSFILLSNSSDCSASLSIVNSTSVETSAPPSVGMSSTSQVTNTTVKRLPSGEQEFREGLDYYYGAKGKKDWKEATTFFTLAANQGNLKAAYYLTLIPEKNYGPLQTNQNDTIDKKYESDSKKIIPNIDSKIIEITKQFELDVKLGLKYAHHPLGRICHARGDGVIFKDEKQKKQAVWHYEQAADAGFDEAQINLGFCYLYGIGIGQNIEQSLTYFQAAAKQKNAMAWYYLAVFYYTKTKQYGHTRKEDMAKAIDYYRKAADAGVPEAQCFLGSYILNRIPYGHEGTSSGIALISLAAKQGLAQAYYLLANYHKSGQYGLKKDYVIAKEYYQAAIRGGFELAKVELEELERETRKLETPDNKILNTDEKSDVSGSSRVTSSRSGSSKFFPNQMVSTTLDYIDQPSPSNQLGNLFEPQVIYRGAVQLMRSASIAEAKEKPSSSGSQSSSSSSSLPSTTQPKEAKQDHYNLMITSPFDPGIALDGQLKEQKYEQPTHSSKGMEITPKLSDDSLILLSSSPAFLSIVNSTSVETSTPPSVGMSSTSQVTNTTVKRLPYKDRDYDDSWNGFYRNFLYGLRNGCRTGLFGSLALNRLDQSSGLNSLILADGLFMVFIFPSWSARNDVFSDENSKEIILELLGILSSLLGVAGFVAQIFPSAFVISVAFSTLITGFSSHESSLILPQRVRENEGTCRRWLLDELNQAYLNFVNGLRNTIQVILLGGLASGELDSAVGLKWLSIIELAFTVSAMLKIARACFGPGLTARNPHHWVLFLASLCSVTASGLIFSDLSHDTASTTVGVSLAAASSVISSLVPPNMRLWPACRSDEKERKQSAPTMELTSLSGQPNIEEKQPLSSSKDQTVLYRRSQQEKQKTGNSVKETPGLQPPKQ